MSVCTTICFRVLGLRREEPTTTAAATYRASRVETPTAAAAVAAAAVVVKVVVRIATPTPLLGQLRRLSRQAMRRAGTSHRTINNVLFFFWSDALLAVCSFLCQFFRGVVVSLHFCTCLDNRSAVVKPHPTEGAEICTGCGNPRCDKGCCAVCTPLVLFVALLCCLGFSFSDGHVILEKTSQTRTSTCIVSIYGCDTFVACLGKPKAREIRCTLQGCRVRRIRESMPLQGTLHCAVFRCAGVTTTRPPAFLLLSQVEQSIGYFPRRSYW